MSKQNVIYFLICLIIPAVTIFPSLIHFPYETINNVLLYKGTRDYGLSIILTEIQKNPLYSGIISSYFSNAKIVLLVSLFLTTTITIIKRIDIYKSLVLLFFTFFIFSPNIGSQYLIWLIPFLILVNLKLAFFYSLISTIALITTYISFNSNALTTRFYLNSLAETLKLPWGIIISVWWTAVIMMFLEYIRQNKLKTITNTKNTIIKVNLLKISIVLFLGFIFSFMVLLPKNFSCINKPTDFFFEANFN